MSEKPILFSSAMVKAILEGRKTQTRRIIQPQPKGVIGEDFAFSSEYVSVAKKTEIGSGIFYYDSTPFHKCPYGKIGTKLWVRETFCAYGKFSLTGNKTKSGKLEKTFLDFTVSDGLQYHYLANRKINSAPSEFDLGWHIRPSIFMPREASRITLEITNIRVERLQDISETDAENEGINLIDFNCWENYLVTKDWCYEGRDQREYHALQDSKMSFASLWDSINAKRGFGWSENPFVWVIEFKKV